MTCSKGEFFVSTCGGGGRFLTRSVLRVSSLCLLVGGEVSYMICSKGEFFVSTCGGEVSYKICSKGEFFVSTCGGDFLHDLF